MGGQLHRGWGRGHWEVPEPLPAEACRSAYERDPVEPGNVPLLREAAALNSGAMVFGVQGIVATAS